jgi:acyl-CoA dehydrogenase
MDTSLPAHVHEFADVAQRRLGQIGGPQAALRAESDGRIREEARQALRDIGADELNPRTDTDDTLAAAVLCHAAGQTLLPYPVVDELMSTDTARLTLIDPRAPRVDHGDLDDRWLLADLGGTTYTGRPGARRPAKLGPFLVPVDAPRPSSVVPPPDIALHLIFQSWRILGSLQRALAIACDHIKAREQFGQPLAAFQSVRFSVADASVAVRGLEELCKFTLSRWQPGQDDPYQRSDALMLKLRAAETGIALMRVCHQLLGALGFCDESDISVIDRHLQPLLRLPLSAEELSAHLVSELAADRIETLFS